MSARRFATDGLKLTRIASARATRPRQHLAPASVPSYRTLATAVPKPPPPPEDYPTSEPGQAPQIDAAILSARRRGKGQNIIDPSVTVDDLVHAKAPWDDILSRADQVVILQALQYVRGQAKSYDKVGAYLTYLLENRQVKLHTYHYNVFMELMSHPRGSAEPVRIMLKEMERHNIPPSPSFWTNCLAALAIHPDYVARNTVLTSMRSNWQTPTTLDQCFSAIGLLRDTQYEMALDKLEEIMAAGPIPTWVLDIFCAVYASLGFHEEAYNLIYQRLKPARHPPTGDLLLFMLTQLSEGYHYRGTKVLWHYISKALDVHVADGVLQNIINTAARHGDAALVLEAMDAWAIRGGKLGLSQFEPLLDCYAATGELSTAARVLSLIYRSRLDVRKGSTRVLFNTLSKDPSLLEVFATHLKEQEHHVPICAFNVLLEVYHSQNDLKSSLALYTSIANYTNEPATGETLSYLIDLASDSPTLSFLADEAKTLDRLEDIRTTHLHKMIHACVENSNTDMVYTLFFSINKRWTTLLSRQGFQDMREAYRTAYIGAFRLFLGLRDKRVLEIWAAGRQRMTRLGSGFRRELDAAWPEVWEGNSALRMLGFDTETRSTGGREKMNII